MIPNKANTYENIYINGIIFKNYIIQLVLYFPQIPDICCPFGFVSTCQINKTAPPAVNKIFATQKL